METKPSIILLHGALGSKEQFFTIQSALNDRFDVYTFNFEGHGGESSARIFLMDHFVENLYDFILREGLRQPVVFGYSMGGYVALMLSIQYPDMLSKIMTLGTKFDWTPDTAQEEIKRLNPAIIEEKAPQFAMHLAEIHEPDDWREILLKTAKMMLSLGRGGALDTEDLSVIKCPVLITIGGQDQMVSLIESHDSAEAIPKAKMHIFRDFKHPIGQIDEELLVYKIKEFLL